MQKSLLEWCADNGDATLAAQWHPTLNGGLTPEMVTVNSHRKVWWQCPEGHVWKAAVYSRAGPRKCGCPVCAGRVSQRRREWQGPPGALEREVSRAWQ